jgi:5-methylcytosine-specific restriction endonuclease McrA
VDHIKSRGAGGDDELCNLRTLCVRCHDIRHNR